MSMEETIWSDKVGDQYVVIGDDIHIPDWIEKDRVTMSNPDHLCLSTLAAIQQGGCESGAYMPAVNYYDARKMMEKHGEDVTGYVQDWHEQTGMDLKIPSDKSWDGLAVWFLSMAVEIWTNSIHDTIQDWEEREESDTVKVHDC